MLTRIDLFHVDMQIRGYEGDVICIPRTISVFTLYSAEP